jgi:acetyltransferase-like isoleucine patch superfamily enzyme
MIKYPKNSVIKGPFPWLANWMYNFIGTNEIGKGTTIEEQACGAKFIEVGDNCYIGVNSILTSHLVEGIFGNIAYFKIKLGNNVTFSALNCIAPGTEINDNSYLLPLACTSKFNNLKGNNYYFGIPLRKIFTKKLQGFLQLTKEDFDRDEELRKKQQLLKSKRSIDTREGD